MVLDDVYKPISTPNKVKNRKILFGTFSISPPPYSLNLAPSYFYLYSLLKKNLESTIRFADGEKVQRWKGEKVIPNATDTVNQKFYAAYIESLIKWWAKRILISGEYV